MTTLVHFSIRVTPTVKRKLERRANHEGHRSVSLVARRVLTEYVRDCPVPKLEHRAP